MTGELPLRVEMRWDGTWHDITDDVRGNPAPDGAVTISRGRRDWASQVDAGTCTLAVNNKTGKFTPRHPTSPLYGKVGRYTPIRVWMGDSLRFVGEVVSWPQRWITTAAHWVPLTALGILRRLTRGDPPLESALRRHYLGFGDLLVGYLPLEEPSGNGRVVSNLVPGADNVKSSVGDDGELLPSWAQDDSCPGSAPLPTWPVVEYFDWARGAPTVPHVAPWQAYLTIRVPEGTGECWLGEWITDGTLPRWALKVNGAGRLQVLAETDMDEGTPRDETWTSTDDPVDDGVWRSVAVTAVSNGSGGTIVFINAHGEDEEFSAVASLEPGMVTDFRARPMFASTSGDPEPIGLGHMAIAGSQPDNTIAIPGNPGPADGHIGERAATRIRRLGDEDGIGVRLPGLEKMLDRFDRTVAAGWGDDWTLVNDGTDWVDGSSGVMRLEVGDGASAQPADVTEPADIDVLVAVEMVTDPDSTAFRSVSLRNGNYAVAISPVFTELQIQRWNGSSTDTVASVTFTDAFLDEGTIWIRAQAIGGIIRARLWHDGHPEPNRWYVSYDDPDPWLDVGDTVLVGAQLGDNRVTLHWRHFELRAADTSVPVGVQRVGTLVDAMREAADTDTGILHEDRTALRLAYRALSTIYNQEGGATLQYQRPSGAGDVHDLTPEDDDQGLSNQLTVSRIGGSSVVARLREGPLSVQDPPDGIGVIPGSASVNVPSDGNLPDHAGWRLHRSTVDETRWPRIGINLARLRRTNRETLADTVAALDSGDRIVVQELPDDLPPVDVDQVVQGYEERMDDQTWEWVANATPFAPFRVLEWADPDDSPGPADPVRFDSGGSSLAVSFQAGVDTTLLVAIADGHPVWDTSADFPLDVAASGVRLRVTGISASQDKPPADRAAEVTDVSTVDAPSVVSPVNDALLICGWLSWSHQISLPGSMSGGAQTIDVFSNFRDGGEVLSSTGATGVRTATLDGASGDGDGFAFSVIIPGASGAPTVVEHLADSEQDGDVVLTTGSLVVGQWLVAIQVFDWAPPGHPSPLEPPSGGDWIPVLTAAQADIFNNEPAVLWVKRVESAGVQEITFYGESTNGDVDDNHARLWVISGAADLSGTQSMTVQQTPINGVEKTIPAEAPLRLHRSVPWAL